MVERRPYPGQARRQDLEQLAQRLRDQGDPATDAWPHGKPKVSAASSFDNLESAQRYTQYNIDQYSGDIKHGLTGRHRPRTAKEVVGPGPNGEVTGTSVTKQPYDPNDPMTGFKQGGMDAKPLEVKNIDTRLKHSTAASLPPSSS